MGMYDVFSASIAARHFNGLFLSGFSFAASYYGLPDIGFNCWTDLVALTQRIRAVLPHHHLLVDIDDGFGDGDIAGHVVSLLEASGASGVIIEDQKRPRSCGHFPGKQLLELDEYLVKLQKVLEIRQGLVVIARTDTSDPDDRLRRAQAFANSGADAVLLEALPNLNIIQPIKQVVNSPIMVNQLAGGKSPSWSFDELQRNGVSLVNYSTPCLFGAQNGIEEALQYLKTHDGQLPNNPDFSGSTSLTSCVSLLQDNLNRQGIKIGIPSS